MKFPSPIPASQLKHSPPRFIVQAARYAREAKWFNLKPSCGYDYCIDFARIDTSEKLLSWVFHLCGKSWCDNALIASLIEECERRFSIKIDHKC